MTNGSPARSGPSHPVRRSRFGAGRSIGDGLQVHDEVRIKDVVREAYGELARRSGSEAAGCCGPDSCCEPGQPELYCGGEAEGVPDGARAASAGCGNPHAIDTLRPGETVVDFGSGGGIDCFIAARAVGPRGRVIGIDMTPDMIDLARQGAREAGLENVEFQLAEMEATPLADDSVDAIITNCVINLAPDKDRVFAEAHRILKTGGRLMISDLVRSPDAEPDGGEAMEDWVACLGGTEPRDVYLDRIRGAGFGRVELVSSVPWRRQRWQGAIESANIVATKTV
ncbi:MAG: methyltransferase domain-containing protein [Chloroflexi bacterium]|nr:methyltransferase domain-containing protein [Chloroflexota bacterium]